MNDCNGCKWWSEMVACSEGLGPVTALCLNGDSCHNGQMVNGGCDKHEVGSAIDGPYRRYE